MTTTWKSLAILAALTLSMAAIITLSRISPAAASHNELTNGDFDDNVDGWTPFGTTWTWISSEDSGGDASSGALEIRIPVEGPFSSGGVQCLPVTGSTEYDFSGDIKIPTTDQPVGTIGTLSLVYFDDASCTGAQLGTEYVDGGSPPIDGAWYSRSETITTPASALSVWFYVTIGGTDPAGPEQSHVLYDNLSLTTSEHPTPGPSNTPTAVAPTNTPVSGTPSATATPAAKTHTPTATTTSALTTSTPASPTPPQPSATSPAGGAGAGGIAPPNTGSGPSLEVSDQSGSMLLAIWVSGAALAAVSALLYAVSRRGTSRR